MRHLKFLLHGACSSGRSGLGGEMSDGGNFALASESEVKQRRCCIYCRGIDSRAYITLHTVQRCPQDVDRQQTLSSSYVHVFFLSSGFTFSVTSKQKQPA